MNNVHSRKSILKIGLFGNPNSGKSSLFNVLTGLKQKTGNFGGVTVDKKIGKLQLNRSERVELVDFPGSYSLHAVSIDEKIVSAVLQDPAHDTWPDLALYVVDITNLERHLLFLTQLIDLGIPVILVLNMSDLDPKAALKEVKMAAFFQIPVIAISAKTGKNILELKKLINRVLDNPTIGISKKAFFQFAEMPDPDFTQVDNSGERHNYRQFIDHINMPIDHKRKLSLEVWDTMQRFEKLKELIYDPLFIPDPKSSHSLTNKFDKILLHPFWGVLVFIFILWLIFQSIFNLAEKPIELLELSFLNVAGWVQNNLPNSWVTDLIAHGIIPGLSGIIVFVPQIALLFIFIGILEETGYMTRVIFLFNFIMQRFGMNGRSIVALISGAACAVPAIMSTRTIRNPKERLITIMATPLISCSARLPVYSLLITYVVPSGMIFGIINKRGLAFFMIYIISSLFALFIAYLLKKKIPSEEPSHLMLELPDYKLPIGKNILITVWEKVKSFITEAGKVILIISVILWAMASFGPADRIKNAVEAHQNKMKNAPAGEMILDIESVKLENSYAGIMGQWIEPAIAPLGFDWKIGIALITSFAAREVFVGTIATIYSTQDNDDPERLSALLAQQVNPVTGKRVFNAATAASLIVFYIFALQCMSTLAVVKKETGSWKWPMIQLIGYSGFAYLASFIVYQIFSRL